MKKKTIKRKLNLNKVKISKLDNKNIKGGVKELETGAWTCGPNSCGYDAPPCL